MTHELPDASARERLRRAIELHDGLRQSLSALTLYSRMLADDLHKSAPSHANQAERLVAMAKSANRVTRQLSQTLQLSTGEHE
jgi:signal transduction histidine kinase